MCTTPLGKYLRKLRIDKDLLMKDMAADLGITKSHLSAIELGKRNLPRSLADKIIVVYKLNYKEKMKFNTALLESAKIIKLDVDKLTYRQKRLLCTMLSGLVIDE